VPADSQTFSRVATEQVEALGELARRAYLDHYRDLWTDGGVAYVARSFAPARLVAELADPRVRYFTVAAEDRPVGFIKLVLDQSLPIDARLDRRDLYLERIYFLAEATGLGLGRAAMAFIDQQADAAGARRVWLRAMTYRPRVCRFYERCGYQVCGADDLGDPKVVPGRGAMLIMRKTLAA
jgi:GNAT superfamily N-acetyltransferase